MSGSAPPPHDGPPPWPPPQPFPAPPQAPYPHPYAYPYRPPGMSEGTKVALIVGGVVGTLGLVVLLLVLVVPMLLGAFFLSQLDDMFEEYGPKAVPVGAAFHWNDADYAAGWQVSREAGDHLRPTGLTLMSSEDAVDSPPESYVIAFVRDGVVVAQASCETEDSIEPGTGNTLRCEPSEDVVGEYDQLVIGYPEDLVTGEPWDTFPDEFD